MSTTTDVIQLKPYQYTPLDGHIVNESSQHSWRIIATYIWARRSQLWPVPVNPWDDPTRKNPGKAPFTREWGTTVKDLDWWKWLVKKFPGANIGIKLGPTANVWDMEVDDPIAAAPVLDRIFGGPDRPSTLSWEGREPGSGRWHYLFLYDDRLAKFGSIVKGVPGGCIPVLVVRRRGVGCLDPPRGGRGGDGTSSPPPGRPR